MIVFIMVMSSLVVTLPALSADPRPGFDEGLRLYQQAKFEEAIVAWEKVVSQGQVSGETYYNLGNAYFRLENFGKSILYYERARRLMPRDEDLEANLSEARHRIVDRIDPPIRLFIWDWADSFRDSLNSYEIARILQALGLLAATAAISRMFVSKHSLKLALARGFSVFLVLFICSAGWYGWHSAASRSPHAVVHAEKSEVFSGPDDSSTQLFSLHEGTTVGIGESLSGWTSVKLIDGRAGWIRSVDLERI